jgi:acyl-CoA thioesterase I
VKRAAIAAFVLTLLFAVALHMKSGREVRVLQPGDSILAFGDSITYGYGAKPGQSYPAVLASMTGLHVINAGVNGETSAEGLARLPKMLEDGSIRLMLLCLGGNDILQHRPEAKLKSNLEQMIAMAKAKGIDVILIGVPEFGIFGLSSLPLYKKIAQEEAVVYMPSLLPDVLGDRSLKTDYVHPNAAGYRTMATRIFERLQEIGYVK